MKWNLTIVVFVYRTKETTKRDCLLLLLLLLLRVPQQEMQQDTTAAHPAVETVHSSCSGRDSSSSSSRSSRRSDGSRRVYLELGTGCCCSSCLQVKLPLLLLGPEDCMRCITEYSIREQYLMHPCH